jgi:hypothetical protein
MLDRSVSTADANTHSTALVPVLDRSEPRSLPQGVKGPCQAVVRCRVNSHDWCEACMGEHSFTISPPKIETMRSFDATATGYEPSGMKPVPEIQRFDSGEF